jgi:putative endonuclease
MPRSSSGLGHLVFSQRIAGPNPARGTLRQAQCKPIGIILIKLPMWFVYLLLCDNKIFYVGITNDLQNRISQHQSKLSTATRKYNVIKVVYCEQYSSKHDAAIREKQLKGWSHAKKQMLIDGKLGRNTCTEFAEALLHAG